MYKCSQCRRKFITDPTDIIPPIGASDNTNMKKIEKNRIIVNTVCIFMCNYVFDNFIDSFNTFSYLRQALL